MFLSSDLTNIEVVNATFAVPFRDELYDQTSTLYIQTTSNISAFVSSFHYVTVSVPQYTLFSDLILIRLFSMMTFGVRWNLITI